MSVLGDTTHPLKEYCPFKLSNQTRHIYLSICSALMNGETHPLVTFEAVQIQDSQTLVIRLGESIEHSSFL